MLVLDVNVVLASQRGDHPMHAPVRAWFDRTVHEEDFGVPTTVWVSFLRLTTNRRVFSVPTPLEAAFAFVDATRAQRHHVPAEPGARHLTLVRQLCRDAAATGDLVPDAVLAAIAQEQGATVATLDRDFARFANVPHLRPGAP